MTRNFEALEDRVYNDLTSLVLADMEVAKNWDNIIEKLAKEFRTTFATVQEIFYQQYRDIVDGFYDEPLLLDDYGLYEDEDIDSISYREWVCASAGISCNSYYYCMA